MSAKHKVNRTLPCNEAFQVLKETYPKAKEVKGDLWELLIAAMGSEHADMWDKKERARKMFLVELLGTLVEKLYK